MQTSKPERKRANGQDPDYWPFQYFGSRYNAAAQANIDTEEFSGDDLRAS
jgi:hypothetical protein